MSPSPIFQAARLRESLWWIVCLLIFAAATFHFTRHNTFPYTYHPDEDTKVRQIVTGKRNFFHPLLMLTATDVAMKAAGIEKTPMNAAITGRWISAIFSALAVCAMSTLAWRWAGWIGGLTAAVFIAINPLVFELAHYFKEDPALLMGLAVTFLAMEIFWKNPNRKSAAFLGLGCALAISGKYLGAVVLLFAAVPVVLRSREKNWWLFGWFTVGLAVPLLLINLPLFLEWNDFRKGLAREVEGATEGHRGVGQSVPHGYYLGRMAELTPWGLWAGLALASALAVAQFRRWSLMQKLASIFPFFFFALLSFSPKTAGRYLLPVEAFASFLAATALGSMFQNERPRLWRYAGIVCGVVIVMGSVSAFGRYRNEFSRDDRTLLREWLNQNTSETALIAEDGRVDLLADARWRARRVESSEYVADLGSISALRLRGVTHVAVARQTYNRFFNNRLKPGKKEKPAFDRRTAFYKELFASGKPVWESPIGEVIYLHPGLRLFSVEAPSQAATER